MKSEKMNVNNYIKKNQTSDKEYDLICEYCKIRYNEKVSQREIANRTGIAQSTIARFEKNIHSASLSIFIKMLDSLGYHLEIKKD